MESLSPDRSGCKRQGSFDWKIRQNVYTSRDANACFRTGGVEGFKTPEKLLSVVIFIYPYRKLTQADRRKCAKMYGSHQIKELGKMTS